METKGAMGHSNGHVITTSVLSLVLFPNDNSTFYRHSQVQDGVSGAFSFFVQQTYWSEYKAVS